MKYIFLDIDGTLFDHKEYAIPESAYRAVDLARKAGNKVFYLYRTFLLPVGPCKGYFL